jgi:hypothetical protein
LFKIASQLQRYIPSNKKKIKWGKGNIIQRICKHGIPWKSTSKKFVNPILNTWRLLCCVNLSEERRKGLVTFDQVEQKGTNTNYGIYHQK